MSPPRAVNKAAEAFVKCIAPDVCLTPMGPSMFPVPYNITCKFDVAERTAPKVNYGGQPAFTMDSRLPRVEGDEQGTGGGIISKVNLGYCRPAQHSGTVRAHGEYVVRHGDLMHMNCNGPDGVANTYGRIVYIGDGGVGEVARERLYREEHVSLDQQTGKTTVEEREISRDPKTGAVTETQQRTVIDPKSGQIQTHTGSVTTGPDGARSYKILTGQIDSANRTSTWTTASGDYIGTTGPVLGRDAIGTVDSTGRMYLGDGMYAPAPFSPPFDNPNPRNGWIPIGDIHIGDGIDGQPPAESPGDIEIPDDDPELLDDPEYQAALKEQADAQKEIDAINKELLWEGAKAAVDIAGTVEPSPIFDAIGAGMALSEGDWVGAGLSIVSMAPYLGDLFGKPAKAGRMAMKVAKLTQKLEKLKDKVKKLNDWAQKAKQKTKDALKIKKRGGGVQPPSPKPKNPGDGGHVPKTGSSGRLPWRSWEEYEKVTVNGREYAKIGDRLYTRHAVDRMQPSVTSRSPLGVPTDGGTGGRSISPTFVEDVIRNGSMEITMRNGVERTVHTLGTVQVVTEQGGRIVVTVNSFSGTL